VRKKSGVSAENIPVNPLISALRFVALNPWKFHSGHKNELSRFSILLRLVRYRKLLHMQKKSSLGIGWERLVTLLSWSLLLAVRR